jgi:hypothetical protein
VLGETAVVDVQGRGNLLSLSVAAYLRSDEAGRSVFLKKDEWDFLV